MNKQHAARGARNEEGALLRGGFARCGYCGRSLAVALDRLEYRCTANADSPGSCPKRPAIRAALLDAAVSTWIECALRHPDSVVAAAEPQPDEDRTADILAVDRLLAELGRVSRNLTASVALVDADSAKLLSERVAVLGTQRQSLELNRAQLLQYQSKWQAQHDLMNGVQEARHTLANSQGALGYRAKRSALEALRLQAIVWSAEHAPRYEIRTAFPSLNRVC